MDPGGRRPCYRWLVKPHATFWDRDVLAELLIRHACGLTIPTLAREQSAAGAMMLPIPRAGFLQRVEGLDSALSVPGIEDIAITAKPAEKLLPFPEERVTPALSLRVVRRRRTWNRPCGQRTGSSV